MPADPLPDLNTEVQQQKDNGISFRFQPCLTYNLRVEGGGRARFF